MQINGQPCARAVIMGKGDCKDIKGEVLFYTKNNMVIVSARISGFPKSESSFHGFHIHEGDSCRGKDFSDTKGHFDPENQPHPFHAGDLPPLLSSSGIAYLEFLTNRFTVNEIIGKTVVIHSDADDFRSQPSGNSGEKIACGVIKPICGATRINNR